MRGLETRARYTHMDVEQLGNRAGTDEAAMRSRGDRAVAWWWELKKTERDFKQQLTIKRAQGVVCLRVRFVAL